MLRRLGLTALATLAVTAVRAETVVMENGNEIYKLCLGNERTNNGQQDKLAVSFYITGIADFIAKTQQYKTLPMYICVPKGTSIKQITETVCSYVIARKGIGSTGQETGAELVSIALTKGYPCH
jgi:Rap1a immunity proteins